MNINECLSIHLFFILLSSHSLFLHSAIFPLTILTYHYFSTYQFYLPLSFYSLFLHLLFFHSPLLCSDIFPLTVVTLYYVFTYQFCPLLPYHSSNYFCSLHSFHSLLSQSTTFSLAIFAINAFSFCCLSAHYFCTLLSFHSLLTHFTSFPFPLLRHYFLFIHQLFILRSF